MCNAIWCFYDVDKAHTGFNFKDTINISTVFIVTSSCVDGDVLKGVFSIANFHKSSRCPTDKNINACIVVAPICIGNHVHIRVNCEGQSLVANCCSFWYNPINENSLFAIGFDGWDCLTNCFFTWNHDFHFSRRRCEHTSVLRR